MKLDKGASSPIYVINKDETVLEDCYVLIFDGKITDFKQLLPVLERVRTEKKSLLIVANDYDNQALENIIVNYAKGVVNVAPVKSPDHGDYQKEILTDIATFTNGKVYSEAAGEKVSEAVNLGYCEKVLIKKDSTVLIGGKFIDEAMEERVKYINDKIQKADVQESKHRLLSRLANLTQGVATLYIGALSELEKKEKIDRADDAVRATRAAIEEGIIAGGGSVLARAGKLLESLKMKDSDEQIGIDILASSLREPLRIIIENSGITSDEIITEVESKNKNYGYDVATHTYGDMIKKGIIDPKKVTRIALESASSVAGVILLTECVLVNDGRNE